MLAALLAMGTAAPAWAQAAVGAISGKTSYDGDLQGYVALLDLSSGAFTPVVTALSDSCRSAAEGQVSLLPTAGFQAASNALLAITANAGPGFAKYVAGTCGTPDGLIVSGGTLVNPGRTNGPVLYFPDIFSAAATGGAVPDSVWWAVAGATTTNNDCGPDLYQPGTLLVDGGAAGACPIPKSAIPAARGAIGVDATGTILIVAVVEGAEGASGLKTADFATLMMGLGAVDAVNFDGGGSAVFYWNPAGGAPMASARLLQMLQDAAVPGGAPNPGGLAFDVTFLAPAQQYVYDTEQRPIYASIGFVFDAAAARR